MAARGFSADEDAEAAAQRHTRSGAGAAAGAGPGGWLEASASGVDLARDRTVRRRLAPGRESRFRPGPELAGSSGIAEHARGPLSGGPQRDPFQHGSNSRRPGTN